MSESAHLARLALRVRDLDACLAYYRDILGLDVVGTDGNRATLALSGRRFEIDLLHDPSASLRPYPCPGLYHFALVVPDRPALGRIFRRLIERRVAFEGMADHAVSEALYLRDPEHNGIELYRDRPAEQWPHDADGSIAMVSDPIDADGILAEADTSGPLDAETRFGHIHLHVTDLGAAETFFTHDLGLSVTQRTLPNALFFAAGDYHHHVAANTWAPGRHVPDGATGLVSYTWRVDGPVRSPLRDPVGAEVLFESG